MTPQVTPVSSMLWVIVGGVIGSFGAVGLKAGAGRLKLNIKALATNWQLIGGVSAYLLSSVFFVKGMNAGQLSVLYPIVAMGQIWTLLWSRIFFQEQITRPKIIAVALILLGVSLVGIGSN
ncbi:MAG: EamA family transporter [Acidobacteriota bacterium]